MLEEALRVHRVLFGVDMLSLPTSRLCFSLLRTFEEWLNLRTLLDLFQR